MLSEVGVVGNGWQTLKETPSGNEDSLTLFSGQESQFICRAGIVGVTLSVVSVFKNYTKTIELLHQDLNNYAS